jgi:beta-fructofuranosidase
VDDGEWQWGGSLVVHEIEPDANGNLRFYLPPEIRSAFGTEVVADPVPRIGKCRIVEDRIEFPPTDGFSWCEMGTMPQTCLIETRVTPVENTRGCGLFIRSAGELETYYQVRLEPQHNRLVFDSWPRPGDRPFTLERPLEMEPGLGVDIDVISDESVIEVYVGNHVAMSTRGYDHSVGSFGLFVSEGSATFEKTRMSKLTGA